MKTLFNRDADRYEKRLKYPVVSAFIENRDKHTKNFLVNSEGTLLDLGAGTGYYLKDFVKNFSRITAVDSSREMLKIFLKNNHSSKISLVCKDVKSFSSKKKFDTIIVIGLLNYLSVNNAIKLIKKLHSLLNRNGKILIAAPTDNFFGHIYKSIWSAKGVSITLYPKDFLINVMKATGFHGVQTKNSKDLMTFHVILEARK